MELIETTAGEIAAELERRGVRPEERIAVLIAPLSTPPLDCSRLSDVARRMRETSAARGLTTDVFDALLAQS